LLGSEELRQAGEGRFSARTEALRGGPSRVEIARSLEEVEDAHEAALRDADAADEAAGPSSDDVDAGTEGERE